MSNNRQLFESPARIRGLVHIRILTIDVSDYELVHLRNQSARFDSFVCKFGSVRRRLCQAPVQLSAESELPQFFHWISFCAPCMKLDLGRILWPLTNLSEKIRQMCSSKE